MILRALGRYLAGLFERELRVSARAEKARRELEEERFRERLRQRPAAAGTPRFPIGRR